MNTFKSFKRSFSFLAAVLFSLCAFGCAGGNQSPDSASDAEPAIAVKTADDLAEYILGYVARTEEENTENHLLSGQPYRLTRVHTRLEDSRAIPDYPEQVFADLLPDSWTVARTPECTYVEIINCGYGAEADGENRFFREKQTHCLYFGFAENTGYITAAIDVCRFDEYAQIGEGEERTYEYAGKWTYREGERPGAEKEEAHYTASLLGVELLNDLFGLGRGAPEDELPALDREDYTRLEVSQTGSVVSFSVGWSKDTGGGEASGTLHLDELYLAADFEGWLTEGGKTVSRKAYEVRLSAPDPAYVPPFDLTRPFVTSPDGLVF